MSRVESISTAETPISRHLSLALLLIAAVVVPWLVLVGIGTLQFDSWASAAAPFAFGRVALVHLLAGLPFSIWVAWHLPRIGTTVRAAVSLAMAAGILVAALEVVSAGAIFRVCSGLTPGQRFTARIAIAFLLQLPWCWGAMRCVSIRDPKTARPPFDLITALLFVIMVPWVYRDQVITRLSTLVQDAEVNRRYLEVWQLVRKLEVMGVDQILGKNPTEFGRELDEFVTGAREEVASELPADADVEQRLRRAQLLHYLHRFAQAQQTLQPLVESDPRAGYLSGLAAEAGGDWATASERYGRMLVQLQQLGDQGDEARQLARNAIERGANNLRRSGRYEEAESLLLQALNDWPLDQATTQFQLGFHYQSIGRVNRATEAFDAAVALNPQLQPFADREREKLKLQMEGCVLRPRMSAGTR